MAKNNFKKKKTLKRSFRRNHTKKVASASLGSRTPNIRKKNRRSQKQRTTLRNKRNARAKVGGVDPVVGNGVVEGNGDGDVKRGFAWRALMRATANEATGSIKTPEQLAMDVQREIIWEAKKKEYNKIIPLELRQKHNNTAIQHKLKHICEEMHNVKDDKREHLLFDAAEKLINSKELSLSDKDIEAAKQEVLSAQNEGARRRGLSPRKAWFFTYVQRFLKVEHTPAYIDTEYQYKYPPAIEYNTRMLEEEIINNPYSLQWPSEYNRYKMFEDDEDDEDE
jgi:hypothetical protein